MPRKVEEEHHKTYEALPHSLPAMFVIICELDVHQKKKKEPQGSLCIF